MKCPKCGSVNTDNEQMCPSCGYELTGNIEPESKAKPEISPKALSRQVLATIIVFLPIYLLSFVSTAASLLTVLWLILRSIDAVREINKRDFSQVKKLVGIVFLILPNLLLVATLIFSIDAEPIPNDYTAALCS